MEVHWYHQMIWVTIYKENNTNKNSSFIHIQFLEIVEVQVSCSSSEIIHHHEVYTFLIYSIQQHLYHKIRSIDEWYKQVFTTSHNKRVEHKITTKLISLSFWPSWVSSWQSPCCIRNIFIISANADQVDWVKSTRDLFVISQYDMRHHWTYINPH